MSNLSNTEYANLLIGLKNEVFFGIGTSTSHEQTELRAKQCQAIEKAITMFEEVDRGFYARNTETVF